MEFLYKDYQWHEGDISKQSILITGGAGFIGSHVVEYLLLHGAGKVRVLDNFSLGARSNLELFSQYPQLEIIEGDIQDISICTKVMQGIDAV
jgi:UDP-N-acetylglucosamine 4-epimerase